MKGDKYYNAQTFKYDNAIVKVYRPILTEEEREHRMQRIADAVARFMMSLETKDPAVLSSVRGEIIKRDPQ